MGAELTFTFTFDEHEGFPPAAVRIWVDDDNDFKPDPDEEVTLTSDGLKWTGKRSIKSSDSGGVWYLVAYAGSIRSKFTFDVRSDTPKDHVVATAEGRVKALRDSFWGMCSK